MSDSIAYLATTNSFTYADYDVDPDKVIEFRRAWWDNAKQGHLWYSQMRDRKGNVLNAKHVTADYAADILRRYREHIQRVPMS